MTYNDIDMSKNRLNPNCQLIKVELNGEITRHFIHGNTKRMAIKNLTRTGWFVNSSRNICPCQA